MDFIPEGPNQAVEAKLEVSVGLIKDEPEVLDHGISYPYPLHGASQVELQDIGRLNNFVVHFNCVNCVPSRLGAAGLQRSRPREIDGSVTRSRCHKSTMSLLVFHLK